MKLADIFENTLQEAIMRKGGWVFVPSNVPGGDKLIFSNGDPAQLIEIGFDPKKNQIYGAVGGKGAFVNPTMDGIKSLIVTAPEELPIMFANNLLNSLPKNQDNI